MDKDELWQEFLENGMPAASAWPKQAFKAGERICGASHVWAWRRVGSTIEILLQRRASALKIWPGYLDISAAGHINEGESPVRAALREADEEIGCALDAGMLVFLFCGRKAPPVYNEMYWVYAYEMTAEAFDFKDGEVTSLEWVTLDGLRKKTEDPEGAKLVPHDSVYFSQLLGYFESL